ncbi:MAG TPA: ABC transporter permease [Opitutaceae bacterium]|nr:ABC transporter permease [Opitutaceae bacterium]HRE08057.1 ABC transporter permease [Opitutaceae bacterium]
MLASLGRFTIESVAELGRFSLFIGRGLASLPRIRSFYRKLVRTTFEMGVRCVPIILTVGCFTGLIVGLEGYRTLARFGSEGALGSSVAVALVNGLAPVLAALMIVGQAGSALAAELGIQRNSEQIDALQTMGIEPLGYFVTPRLLAALFVFPLHTVFFNFIGLFGGFLSGVVILSQEPGVYWQSVQSGLTADDVYGGLVKSVAFGFTVTAICAYEGFNTHRRSTEPGVRGVSASTTRAVVYSSIAVLTLDYLITAIQH